MNLQSIENDITKLNKALELVQQTENYLIINKSAIMSAIIEQIFNLQDKRDRQEEIIEELLKGNTPCKQK